MSRRGGARGARKRGLRLPRTPPNVPFAPPVGTPPPPPRNRGAPRAYSQYVTRLERNANIAAVVIPFLGVLAAAVLLWNRFLGARDLAIFAVMYMLTAIGVTVGYHRLLTHRAFQTH